MLMHASGVISLMVQVEHIILALDQSGELRHAFEYVHIETIFGLSGGHVGLLNALSTAAWVA